MGEFNLHGRGLGAQPDNAARLGDDRAGVGVEAQAENHRPLDGLACQDLALLVISSELPGIRNLSRRIIVMRDGDMVGELERADSSPPTLMRLMEGEEARAA